MRLARLVLAAPVCAWLSLHAPAALAQDEAPAQAPLEAAAEGPLTLERAVVLAAERNEVALAASSRAEAAQARLARARAFFFPELSTTGTYTRRLREITREVGGQRVVLQRLNAFSGVAVARLPLFDARAFPLLSAARLEGRAAALDALEARRQVGFEAAGAFLATLGAQQVLDAARQRLEFARRALEEARARTQGGLASTNDVTRAELEVASAEVQLAEAQGSAQTAVLELGYLLVSRVEGPLAPPAPLLAEATGPTQRYLALAPGAEERRPDILSAHLRVQAQEALAREPLARLLPSLGATAQYRVTNEAGLAGRTGDGFLGVDLTWNLFDGGERYAERRERLALASAVALEARALTRRVDVDIKRAQAQLDSAQAALRQAQLAARVARQNADESQLLYRQGLATALTVADASVRFYEAEVSLARASYAVGVALLELRAAVGLDALGNELEES